MYILYSEKHLCDPDTSQWGLLQELLTRLNPLDGFIPPWMERAAHLDKSNPCAADTASPTCHWLTTVFFSFTLFYFSLVHAQDLPRNMTKMTIYAQYDKFLSDVILIIHTQNHSQQFMICESPVSLIIHKCQSYKERIDNLQHRLSKYYYWTSICHGLDFF